MSACEVAVAPPRGGGVQTRRGVYLRVEANSCFLNEVRETVEAKTSSDTSATAAPLLHPAFFPPLLPECVRSCRRDEVVALGFLLSAYGFCHRGTVEGQRRESVPEQPDGQQNPTLAECR